MLEDHGLFSIETRGLQLYIPDASFPPFHYEASMNFGGRMQGKFMTRADLKMILSMILI
jgi:hypothetical protein